MDNEIKLDDYILITDTQNDNFSEIGQVISIDYFYDGEPETYTVRFKNCINQFGYDFNEICEVLVFR